MKLTIAQFAWGLTLGGMEQVIISLAKEFHKKGHNSSVCTTITEGMLLNKYKDSGLPFHFFGLKTSYDLRALVSVIRYLKNNKVNVIITHGLYGNFIPRIAAILLKTPVIIHVEHNVSDQKKFHHIMINKILSTFTDKIICVSEKAKQSLMEIEKIKPDKICVIHNGLDTSCLSPINKDQNRNGKIRVGIIASFTEQKGHVYFVDAAARVVESFKDVEFIYIGDGPLRPSVEKKVMEYGLDKYSRFLGARLDVGDLLKTLDIFVLSSLWEGLPISLLEAQYSGIPSVVTEVGGNPEVIEDGYNGLLVPPKDSEKLATAIFRVINNNKLRNDIGLNAQKVFNQNFSVDKMTNNYLNILDTIISK
jgi:glycosyltransferase involved in cell wall biosynthesis